MTHIEWASTLNMTRVPRLEHAPSQNTERHIIEILSNTSWLTTPEERAIQYETQEGTTVYRSLTPDDVELVSISSTTKHITALSGNIILETWPTHRHIRRQTLHEGEKYMLDAETLYKISYPPMLDIMNIESNPVVAIFTPSK